jgi:hypothetical protein
MVKAGRPKRKAQTLEKEQSGIQYDRSLGNAVHNAPRRLEVERVRPRAESKITCVPDDRRLTPSKP